MNTNTKNFANIKGKLPAMCDYMWGTLKEGKIYNIEFEEGLTSDNEQYVYVYDGTHYICRCNCERFSLLGEEE